VVSAHSSSQSANLLEIDYSGNPSGAQLACVSGGHPTFTFLDGNGVRSHLNLGYLKRFGIWDGDTGTSNLRAAYSYNFQFASGGVTAWSDDANDAFNGTNTGLRRDSQSVLRVVSTFLDGALTTDRGAGALICGWSDAGTTSVATGLYVRHNTTATPGAGLGVGQVWQLDSSTTANRLAAEEQALWATATDASRKGRWVAGAHDASTSSGSPREGIRVESDGTQALLGFYGVAATARQLLATGAGHTVDDVIAALQALGLVRQS
jgi:hypothetical protein